MSPRSSDNTSVPSKGRLYRNIAEAIQDLDSCLVTCTAFEPRIGGPPTIHNNILAMNIRLQHYESLSRTAEGRLRDPGDTMERHELKARRFQQLYNVNNITRSYNNVLEQFGRERYPLHSLNDRESLCSLDSIERSQSLSDFEVLDEYNATDDDGSVTPQSTISELNASLAREDAGDVSRSVSFHTASAQGSGNGRSSSNESLNLRLSPDHPPPLPPRRRNRLMTSLSSVASGTKESSPMGSRDSPIYVNVKDFPKPLANILPHEYSSASRDVSAPVGSPSVRPPSVRPRHTIGGTEAAVDPHNSGERNISTFSEFNTGQFLAKLELFKDPEYKFDGSREKYVNWSGNLLRKMDLACLDGSERLQILQNHTTGSARIVVDTFADVITISSSHALENFQEAWNALRERFGSKGHQVDSLYTK